MRLDLFIEYEDNSEEVIDDLTVDEVADFIENRLEQGAVGFGVYLAEAVLLESVV